MKKTSTALMVAVLALIISCRDKTEPSVKADAANRSAAVDSAKSVMQNVFLYSNKLDFEKVFQFYSGDSDARYVENGSIFTLAAMKEAYREIVPATELLENAVKSWDMIALSDDAVLATLPVHVKLKVKGRDPYEFDYVWSAVAQKRNGKWQLIQSHESWLDYAKAMAAISPPPAGGK